MTHMFLHSDSHSLLESTRGAGEQGVWEEAKAESALQQAQGGATP